MVCLDTFLTKEEGSLLSSPEGGDEEEGGVDDSCNIFTGFLSSSTLLLSIVSKSIFAQQGSIRVLSKFYIQGEEERRGREGWLNGGAFVCLLVCLLLCTL